jgi:hypothetical protein
LVNLYPRSVLQAREPPQLLPQTIRQPRRFHGPCLRS